MIGVLLIVAFAGFLFLRFQVQKSFPETSGSISINGLHQAVNIIRDEYGVPRLDARDEHDLMFALGYVHAQDRLWQMDMARRVGEGRLSELFGPVTLQFDKMFRIVGIRKISEEIEQSISAESKNRLESYSDGVNAFISAAKGKYPIEFDMLQYEPEPWRAVHSIMIGRLMAWELNLSWWTDLTYGALVEKLGLETVQEILPPYPSDVERIAPRMSDVSSAYHIGSAFLQTAQEFRSHFGLFGALGGSNAWVVAPTKSESGKPILANDIHLQLQNPSKWYEVHLRAPGYSVGGMSIPGVPGIVLGSNNRIAWGLTNLMADDADFYIEQIDEVDSTKYLYDGKWLPLTFREEEIRVKGDSLVTFLVRSTHHGPIVTDIKTMLKKTEYQFAASMRWTGFEVSDQIEAFNKVNKATNREEFIRGVREFTGPGQNFLYADVEGNIGYWCGVKLPIRSQGISILPLPGWEKTSEWKGFVPFEKLPHLYNPPEAYIASANNKMVDDSYPYHISDLWEPPSRIIRLREILGKEEIFSMEDFERLQNDRFSHHAKEMTWYLLDACKDSVLGISDEQLVFEYLRNWNFYFNEEDIATTIYQEFFVRLLRNIYSDEMGDDLFHDFVQLANVPIRVTTKLVQEDTSKWFDNVSTEQVERRDDILRQSLREAVTSLRQRLGSEMKTWRWGDVHTLTLQHPFGLQKPLDRIFNIGPFPYGGGETALVSGEYSFNNPFQVTVGASMRQIVDLARPHEVRRVIPGGQSGQVFHPHFSDQVQLWLHGSYRTVVTDPAFVPHGQWDNLRLEPSR